MKCQLLLLTHKERYDGFRIMTPHQNQLGERDVMRGLNICFHGKIRKIIHKFSLLPFPYLELRNVI